MVSAEMVVVGSCNGVVNFRTNRQHTNDHSVTLESSISAPANFMCSIVAQFTAAWRCRAGPVHLNNDQNL